MKTIKDKIEKLERKLSRTQQKLDDLKIQLATENRNKCFSKIAYFSPFTRKCDIYEKSRYWVRKNIEVVSIPKAPRTYFKIDLLKSSQRFNNEISKLYNGLSLNTLGTGFVTLFTNDEEKKSN